MAVINPIKGHAFSLTQLDRSLPVVAEESSKLIDRGSILSVTEEGKFQLAADATTKPLYLSLANYEDLQSGMAGDVEFGKGEVVPGFAPGAHIGEEAHNAAAAGQPKITGIDLSQDAEYEIDVFDKEATHKIGSPLTVKDGKVTSTGADKDNTIGYVTLVPYKRYVNNAVAVPGRRLGARVWVIRFVTA